MTKLDIDRLFLAQRAAIDALVSVGATALVSAERVAALNLHGVREAMVDFAQGTQALLKADSVHGAVKLQQQLGKPQVEKGIAYSRSLYEISSVAQEDAVRMIETQYNGFMQAMSELAKQVMHTAPVGSEVSVALIRSTMRSASEAFERFNEAVGRFAEVAEESVSTVGNATVSVATGKKVPKPSRRQK